MNARVETEIARYKGVTDTKFKKGKVYKIVVSYYEPSFMQKLVDRMFSTGEYRLYAQVWRYGKNATLGHPKYYIGRDHFAKDWQYENNNFFKNAKR